MVFVWSCKNYMIFSRGYPVGFSTMVSRPAKIWVAKRSPSEALRAIRIQGIDNLGKKNHDVNTYLDRLVVFCCGQFDWCHFQHHFTSRVVGQLVFFYLASANLAVWSCLITWIPNNVCAAGRFSGLSCSKEIQVKRGESIDFSIPESSWWWHDMPHAYSNLGPIVEESCCWKDFTDAHHRFT